MQPPQIAAAFIENCFRQRMIGRSIVDVEVLWKELYNVSRPFGQQGAAVNTLSGTDIALWDAIGKFLGQPVFNVDTTCSGFRNWFGCFFTIYCHTASDAIEPKPDRAPTGI
jgi:hypothetical protein